MHLVTAKEQLTAPEGEESDCNQTVLNYWYAQLIQPRTLKEQAETVRGFNEMRRRRPNLVIDFSHREFSGVDLSGINLSGALLAGAVFRLVRLDGANLENADLGEAVWIDVSANRASLVGTDIDVETLAGAGPSIPTIQGITVWQRGKALSRALQRIIPESSIPEKTANDFTV